MKSKCEAEKIKIKNVKFKKVEKNNQKYRALNFIDGGSSLYNYLLDPLTEEEFNQLNKQLFIQSKSFDEVINLAKDKATMLAGIPAIQPISNEELTRMASGFGRRIDPIYKTNKFHYGMDYAAPIGTPVYATGNGIIEKVVKSRIKKDYGNYILIPMDENSQKNHLKA